MDKMKYRVYCKGILGVKTNISDFKWVYGSVAPDAEREEYERCRVKFDIRIKPEKELGEIVRYDARFQAYAWDYKSGTLYYRRTMLHRVKIGYNLSVCENTVVAEIGEAYYRLVKNRIMNLHSAYYLLSDLANVILLENGFLTLYASAVNFSPRQRGVVHFAPPNTGKTLTAEKLCEIPGYSLVGEDIVITDGERLYACPWTSSKRKKGVSIDSAGSLGRAKRTVRELICEESPLTHLIVLSIGEGHVPEDQSDLLRKIKVLNGYLFNYYSSPIVKVLSYFDERYGESWNDCAEKMLESMVDRYECLGIQAEKPTDLSSSVHTVLLDGET